MGLIFRPLWTGSGKKWRKMAWIGPDNNFKPEKRRRLSSSEKQFIVIRQKNKCRFCNEKINTHPYICGDFDHIIPLNMGGKNSPCNIQLLCVSCHRQKPAHENKGLIKVIDIGLTKNDVYVVSDSFPKYNRPFNMKTPIEIEENDLFEETFIVSYSDNHRNSTIIEDSELDNIFSRFKYNG